MPAGAGGHIKRYANIRKRETLATEGKGGGGCPDWSPKGQEIEEEELL